jgi:hypothetical protein
VPAGQWRWPAGGSSGTPTEGGAHPQVQVGVGELVVEELQGRHGLAVLQLGDALFLDRDGHLVVGDRHLCGGDQGVLLGGGLLDAPLRAALFDAGLQLVGLHLRFEVVLGEFDGTLDLGRAHDARGEDRLRAAAGDLADEARRVRGRG